MENFGIYFPAQTHFHYASEKETHTHTHAQRELLTCLSFFIRQTICCLCDGLSPALSVRSSVRTAAASAADRGASSWSSSPLGVRTLPVLRVDGWCIAALTYDTIFGIRSLAVSDLYSTLILIRRINKATKHVASGSIALDNSACSHPTTSCK